MKQAVLMYLLIIFYNSNVSAQAEQNKLTIEQTVEVTLPNDKVMTNKVIFYIKNEKVKSVSAQNGMEMNVYYFDSTKVMHTVVNMSGQIQKNELVDAINKTNNEFDRIEVKYYNDTKEIAGTVCNKAILLLEKKGVIEEKEVWYDPNIVLSFKYNFGIAGLELIQGLPMQYENNQMGMKMRHTVNKLDTSSPISDETFNF